MAQVKDYATLSQAILDFSHRDSLSPFVDYLIQDGEDRIYRKILASNEGKGLHVMEAPLSYSISSLGVGVVPADWLAPKYSVIAANSANYPLIHKDGAWIYDNWPIRTADGVPQYVAVEGSSFIFGPFPDSTYAITGQYYQRAAALSATNTTTWMTTQMPMALLAACMVAAAKWLKDEQGAQGWMAEMSDRLGDIITADKAQDYASGSLVMDIA